MSRTKKSPTKKRARKSAAPPATAPGRRDAVGTSRELTFNLKGLPAAKRKEPCEGTSRRAALDALRERPRSFEELHKLAGWGNRRSTYDGPRLLGRVSGFGLQGTSESIKLA